MKKKLAKKCQKFKVAIVWIRLFCNNDRKLNLYENSGFLEISSKLGCIGGCSGCGPSHHHESGTDLRGE
jgi:hypothetical protein